MPEDEFLRSLVKPFLGNFVAVDTPVGEVYGFLSGYNESFHHGLGSLVLTCLESGWLIVRAWLAIKSCEWLMCWVMMRVMAVKAFWRL
ncbi:MAG: hypothetical protein QXR45_13045 [Candidatus Bathyarchaeia archaeon]